MVGTTVKNSRAEVSPRSSKPQVDPPATDTLQSVLKLSNKLMAPFTSYLERQYKISLNEFRLLMLIGRFPDLASHELAEMTGVNPMSVSRAVAALEKHGRIEVVRDTANRRRKTLALTADGQSLYAVMRPQTDKVADYLVSALDAEEIGTLNSLLNKLIATLDERDEEGRSRFMERTRPA
jgi:DNA-binding MarR family transcriptional regulator